MSLFVYGVSHRTAPVELLEKVAMDVPTTTKLLKEMRTAGEARGAFGLCTCNRVEFYLDAENPAEALNSLFARIDKLRGIDLRARAGQSYYFGSEATLRHLFRVACGIDSLIVGESEILGQIRKARETAVEAGLLDSALDDLLLAALELGGRARTETGIARGNVSVASVAATLAARHFVSLAPLKGVVLGAGETAELAGKQLRERGLGELTVANRTYKRAENLAHVLDARAAAMEELERALADADVAVCATGAPHFIITKPMAEGLMATRPSRPLLFLDMSMPRNVDPAVEEVPGISLYSIDTMKQIAEENRAQRESEIGRVEALIEEEVGAVGRAEGSTDTTRLVTALHRRVDEIRRAHIERYGHHFDEEHRPHLDKITAGLTRSVLHELTEKLRALDLSDEGDRRRFELALELFGLEPAARASQRQ